MSKAVNEYSFGVKFADLYTGDGQEVPRIKAVVREDDGTPIATVGSRYHLISHADALSSISQVRKVFGKGEEKILVWNRGAKMAAIFDYRDKITKFKHVGDAVGLRVIIENSYDSSAPLRITVGGLVLSCLNGMVSQNTMLSYAKRHVAGTEVPVIEPEVVVSSFNQEFQDWDRLAATTIDKQSLENITTTLVERAVVTNKCNDYVHESPGDINTYWDLLQKYTYFITHESKANFSRKVSTTRAVTRTLLTW